MADWPRRSGDGALQPSLRGLHQQEDWEAVSPRSPPDGGVSPSTKVRASALPRACPRLTLSPVSHQVITRCLRTEACECVSECGDEPLNVSTSERKGKETDQRSNLIAIPSITPLGPLNLCPPHFLLSPKKLSCTLIWPQYPLLKITQW